MPVIWLEPFGLAMIEATACGTPVIAFNRGSVPQIIDDGVTGCIVANKAGAVAADHHDAAGRHHAQAETHREAEHDLRANHETKKALDHGKHALFHEDAAAIHHMERCGSHRSVGLT